MLNLNTRDIEYVLMIAQEGNITKAAQKLYIAQPSLSQALKKIEQDAGTKLFTRVKSRLKLTESGEVFVEAALQISSIMHELESKMANLSDMQSGKLSLGVPYLLGSIIASNILPMFRQQYPLIELSVIESTSSELEQMLMNGTIDVAVMPLPFKFEEFNYQPLMKSRMILLVSKDNPINDDCYIKDPKERFPYIDIKKLNNAPFILGKQGQRIRFINDAILKKAQITPRIVMTSRNLETIKRMAACDIGFALIPEQYLEIYGSFDIVNCYYIEPDVDYEWQVVVAYFEKEPSSSAARSFLKIVKNFYKNNCALMDNRNEQKHCNSNCMNCPRLHKEV